MPITHRNPRPFVSVNAMAREIHNAYVERQKPTHSPYNKPWTELSAEERKKCSRGTLATIQLLNTQGHRIDFVDEYADPDPAHADFLDPEVVK
jgi:hypothetical protein